jgi:hypothetical protein
VANLRERQHPASAVAAALAIAAALLLLALKDIHGAAAVAGMILALFLEGPARHAGS